MPDPKIMCSGECEGLGFYPVNPLRAVVTTEEKLAWEKLEAENPSDDGWHFITCLVCEGTGKNKGVSA